MTTIAGEGVATSPMTRMVCGECGIQFHVPAGWEAEKQADHTTWYCPNGHSRHYVSMTVAEEERSRADALARQLDRERCHRVSAEHRLRTVKGHQTRLKKRLASGCCPCCDRTFANLGRHMASQHPDFAGGTDA